MFRIPANLLRIYAVVVLTYTTEGFIDVAFSPYLQQQGVGLANTGGIIALMFVASLVSRIPSGMLYTASRATPLIVGGSFAVAVATFVYPRSDSEPVLGALRLLHGFGFGLATTANMAQFFDARPAEFDRGRAMGYFAAALAAGNLIGKLVGGWWADAFGFESAFTLAALFPLLAGLCNLGVRAPAERARKAEASSRVRLEALRNPRVLLAALLLFSLNFLNNMFGPFFNLYALSIGLSLTVIGLLKSASSLSGVFTRIFAGELGKIWSYETISRAGITLSALLIIAVPLFQHVVVLGGLVISIAVLRSIITVTGAVSVIDATDASAEQRGVASGIFNIGKDLGSICGPLFGGAVADVTGVGSMLQALPIVILVVFWCATIWADARLSAQPAARTKVGG